MIAHETETPEERSSAVDTVAGLMAAAALFLAFVAVAYRPARIAPAAIVIALVAGGMSRRWSRLAAWGAYAGALGWLAGMAIAVVLDHPVW